MNGQWNAGRGLSLWDRCFQARFDRLVYANLELGRQALDLCPVPGKHVLQAGAAKLRIAAGTSALDLAGTFGGTQLRIASGPVGFAWPGTLTAKALNVQLGPRESGVNFAVSDFTGQLGSRLSGRFEGADILLASVPLDILSASGNWKYQGNVLSVGDGAFMLEDREEKERFEPLVAQGASLTLADGVILADAILRTPVNEAEIMATRIRHDLAGGTGFADLDVSGITFGSGLQPTDLTDLATGVVANVDGRVTGNGRIDWNADVVTSTGSFSSNDLDLAAAFGPVEGVSGTIVFDDLLGLTTAPEQRLSVRSLNPGIEVFDGTVQFALTGGEYLDVQEAGPSSAARSRCSRWRSASVQAKSASIFSRSTGWRRRNCSNVSSLRIFLPTARSMAGCSLSSTRSAMGGSRTDSWLRARRAAISPMWAN